MPTLDWIGKDKVVNHHLDVPYRVMERRYSYDETGQHDEDNGSENMIIHGDNLEALKSLLPQYEGKIKCIYIDPPYNTGNENWVYNDNVNDPRIINWLGKVVGPEGKDLSRHDKWLCMMYPRLKLLQRLLADDGAIFISIDDTEYANLRVICDEILGSNCFVSNISWQRTYSMRNDAKGIPAEVEHILVYSRNVDWQPQKLGRTESMDSKYKNPDNDPRGVWRNIVASAPNASTHQGMVYAIQNPITGEYTYPPQGRCWSLGQDQMLEAMCQWCEYTLADLQDYEARAKVCNLTTDVIRKDVMAIVLKDDASTAKSKAMALYQNGPLPEFFFSRNGYGALSRKAYLQQMGGRPVTNLWPFEETGHTDEASRLLKTMFGGTAIFDTPKPPRLIERILHIIGDKKSLVLDSFAGSGTTAHAVLNMNKADGGNRRFILIEMMDYADGITAERVKRVIDGYGDGSKAVEGTGGNFSYYELGEPLMVDDVLNENVGVNKIREYVYFTETKCRLPKPHPDEPYYMGIHINSAYYFYYERNDITTLNREFLHTVKTKADAYVIYADTCVLSDAELDKYHITFKKIPRDITRL